MTSGTRSPPSPLTFAPGAAGLARFLVTEEVPSFLSEAYGAASTGRPARARRCLTDEALEPLVAAAAGGCSAQVCFLLGLTFFQLKDWEASEQWFTRVLQVCPHGMVYYQLGRICSLTNRTSEAMGHFERAYAHLPEHMGICASHGADLIRLGRTQEGVALLRKAAELAPENALPGSKYLYSLSYLDDGSPADIRAAHEAWARRHAPLHLARVNHANDPDPDRRLRIGYLSSEFRRHSAAYNFEPYLDWHDRRRFELFGYSQVKSADEVTRRFAEKFDAFRDIHPLDDRAAAGLIERDRIDILVIVGGHTQDNRLPVLAYKPAPIQIEFGAVSTTGMRQIDYRLTDRWIDGSATEANYTERPLYLTGGVCCYHPPSEAPEVAPLPLLRNGYVTYASLNNSAKISDKAVTLWAEILKACPKSQLMLKFRGAESEGIRSVFAERFRRCGVTHERLQFHGWQASGHHLELYNRADIALDTFPFGGCVTSLETLWMGLPIVSLARTRGYWVSRLSGSLLERTGLGFFVSETEAAYRAKALALAADPDSLARIRASLRGRMRAPGGVCDGKHYMKGVEAALRQAWREWTSRVTQCKV